MIKAFKLNYKYIFQNKNLIIINMTLIQNVLHLFKQYKNKSLALITNIENL